MRSSIVLAFAGVSLLATAAAAGDLNSAVLRGSRAYEATPSYQIAAALPSDAYAPPPSAAVMAPASAASGYSFEFGARYWYSSGSSPRTFTTIRASPTISSRG